MMGGWGGQGVRVAVRFPRSQDGQVAAIELAREDRDGSRVAMNGKKFAAEYCMPLKLAEEWIARKKAQFGKTACDTPSFRRVETFLLSGRGRVAVLGCVGAKLGSKLEGHGPDSGIEACKALQRELQQARSPASAPPPEKQPAAAPENDDGQGAAAASEEMEIDAESETEQGPDPVDAIIKENVEKALAEFAIDSDWTPMVARLKRDINRSTRVVFLLDAPTSRAKILMAMIDKVGELLGQVEHSEVHVLVPCGTRLDLLSSVSTRLATSCPSLASFTLQLTHQAGSQKLKKKAAFAQYGVTAATLTPAQAIPTSIPALAARLSPGECTRMRCMDSACKFRPQPATEEELKAIKQDPSAEIAADDKVETGVEDMQECAEDAPADPPADDLQVPGARRDCLSDLWPFAFGKDFYKAMCQQLLPGLAVQLWVVLTTCAHPSAAVAGHELGAKVHVFQDRVSAHAAGHGRHLLRQYIERTVGGPERAKRAAKEKRMRDEDVVFLSVAAPEEQPILFWDVQPDVAGSSWRARFDTWPQEQAMETSMSALVESERTDFKMCLEQRHGKTCLVTRKSVKEGDLICQARALLFGSASRVRKFLEKGSGGG